MKKFILIGLLLLSNLTFSNNLSFNNEKKNKKYWHLGYYFNNSALYSNLNNLNNTIHQNSKKLNSITNTLLCGFDVTTQKKSFSLEIQIPLSQRIYISDYEQIKLSRRGGAYLFGLTFLNKKQNLYFYPQIGISTDFFQLEYYKDSIGKSPSIDWINRGTNPNNQLTFNNWGFSLLGNIRILKKLNKHFGVNSFLRYQYDLSNGDWRFQEDFVIKSSPKTYLSGIVFGIGVNYFFISEN